MKKIFTLLTFIYFVFGLSLDTNAQFVDIGSGTAATGTYDPSPIGIWYKSMHYQVVYTAAEIYAAGGQANGVITGLGWYVNSAPQYLLPGYTIKIKHTTAANANVYDGVGLTTAVVIPSYMPTAGGYDVTSFSSSSFTWNGADNILIDVCFNVASNYSSSGGFVRTFAGTSRYIWNDASSQCGVATNNSTSYRPQVRFQMTAGTPLTCFQPTNLSATNVTANTAQLNWTTGGAFAWVVEYGPQGYTPGTGTIVTTGTNPETLTNLLPATVYTYCIKDLCGVGDTSFQACGTFTTPCVTFTAPYLQTFDASLTTPICWTNVGTGSAAWLFLQSGGPGPDYGVYQSVDHTSGVGNFAWMDGSYSYTGNSLITPTIDFSAMTQAVVGCWILSNNIDDGAQNKLKIDAWNGTSWVNLTTYTGNFPGWKRIYVPIPASIPSTTYFRMVQEPTTVGGSAFYNDLLIDDFFVDESPTCFEPTALVDSIVDPYSASLSWTSGGATNWIIEYGPIGFTPGTGTTVSTSTNPTIITGLTPGADYGWFVRDSCGVSDVSWASSAENFRLPGVVVCGMLNNFTYCNPVDVVETFTYQAENGTSQLHFKFNSGVTGGYTDFNIYDGPNNTYPILYSGTGYNNMTGVEFTSSGSIVTFEWNGLYGYACGAPLNFDVNCCEATFKTEDIRICKGSSYTLVNGVNVSHGGAYEAIVTNALGCDSVISYIVIQLPDTTTKIANLCLGSSFVFADGTSTNLPGQYQRTVLNMNGCDSTINYTLNVFNPSSSSMNAGVCQGEIYTLPDGTTANSAGIYTATIPNSVGCDSVITVNLSIYQPSSATKNVQICEGEFYVLPDGVTATTTGTYTSSVKNSYNCPHIITTNLTVVTTSFADVVVEICGDETYTLLNGDVVNESGEYNISIANAAGCDSIVTVFVSKCSAIGDLNEGVLSIYPNPARSIVNVLLNDALVGNNVDFKIINSLGQTVYSNTNIVSNELNINVESFSNGLYFIVLSDNESTSLHKFMVSK